ncbi:hypothetical protein C0989_008777 [Termitomyces sp. Mn162]|nr:hypothetical protein C0989_008777 [Termitomyces sp. Mn162]
MCVYVTSEPFEIKATGSTYPTVTPGLASASSSATGSGANAAATSSSTGSNDKPNSAVGIDMKAASVVGAVAGVLGLMM